MIGDIGTPAVEAALAAAGRVHGFPVTDDTTNRLVWACCLSVIDPRCRHTATTDRDGWPLGVHGPGLPPGQDRATLARLNQWTPRATMATVESGWVR